MSEFQCYKFKTIDRPLSDQERQEVDALSSRGHVTATSATFIYHYSDFRHDVKKVLEKYFDAMLYFSNWGTRRLLFRLPAQLMDAEAICKYAYENKWGDDHLRIWKKGEYYLMDFYQSDEDGGEWMEEDDYELGDLAVLRHDILQGDYRSLYLFWASISQLDNDEEKDEDENDFGEIPDEDAATPPPPVPAGMKKLSSALKSFIGYFQVGEDLVAAVQSASPTAGSALEYKKLLPQLPPDERTEWLVRLLDGETSLDILLKKRLEQLSPAPPKKKEAILSPAELSAKALLATEARKKRETAAARAAHKKRMQELAKQEESLWKSVSFNINRQTGKSYDLATSTLKDLKDLAEFQGKQAAFKGAMLNLKEEFSRRTSLIKRWEAARLF